LRETFELYKIELKSLQNGKLLNFDIENGEVPLWPELMVNHRALLESALQSEGVGFRKFWHPLSKQPGFLTNRSDLTVSVRESPKLMWLPSSFSLSKSDIQKISRIIRRNLDLV
jgi:dTDP-4-amino-4,6-dideoxygalactose transaminase